MTLTLPADLLALRAAGCAFGGGGDRPASCSGGAGIVAFAATAGVRGIGAVSLDRSFPGLAQTALGRRGGQARKVPADGRARPGPALTLPPPHHRVVDRDAAMRLPAGFNLQRHGAA